MRKIKADLEGLRKTVALITLASEELDEAYYRFGILNNEIAEDVILPADPSGNAAIEINIQLRHDLETVAHRMEDLRAVIKNIPEMFEHTDRKTANRIKNTGSKRK